MLAAIHCLDDAAHPGRRNQFYEAHLTYLANQTDVNLVMTGPLFDEKNENRIGSLLVVEAASLEVVKTFSDNDPFKKNGVFGQVRINPFLIANSNPVKEG